MNTPTDTNRVDERLNASRTEYYAQPKKQKSSCTLKITLTLAWAVCHFIFYLIQQIAEIFAPILLILGILWKALPSALHSLIHVAEGSTDQQTHDTIGNIVRLIPTSLTVSGHVLTASSLIFDGFSLLVLTSIAATITSFLDKKI